MSMFKHNLIAFAVVIIVLFHNSNVLVVEASNECHRDSQCSGIFSYCCERKGFFNNVCRSKCLGETCLVNDDCAPGECCNSSDVCSTVCLSDTSLAGSIIAVIVISIVIAIAIPVGIVFCCCCGVAAASRRPAQGGVVLAQPVGGVTVAASQNTLAQQSYYAANIQTPYSNYPIQGQIQMAQTGLMVPPAHQS